MINDVKCAAIILNYNDADNAISLSRTLSSYAIVDNIIIVDNCSTDNSWAILSDFSIAKVSCYKSNYNGGYGFGNNFGIRIAKNIFNCKLAFICNTDISVSEECLDSLASILINYPNAAICSSIQINGFNNQEIKGTTWNVPTAFDYIRNSLLILKYIFPQHYDVYIQPVQEVGCVAGAFLGVDIDRFLSFGGYDEEVFLFCEESIIGYKAKSYGYKTYIDSRHNYYHYHSTSINKSYPKEISKIKILFQSRKTYLYKYLKIHGLKKLWIEFVFSIAMLEHRLKNLFFT